MTKIEIYSNSNALSDRIYELRADGVKDKNMTVVANNRIDATFLRYTRIPFKKADGTMWDKIAAKFLDEDSERRVTERLKLTGQDNASYRKAIDDGEIILLVRSLDDEIEEIKEEEGSPDTPDTQDQVLQTYGLQSEKSLQHEEPKKKRDNRMDKAEIIHEDGDKRTVSLDGKLFTIVNMKHELKEKNE